MNAPSDGKFFKTDGVTSCSGQVNKAVVRMAYDDFNALIAAGDGTVEIEVIASEDVEDVCDICCEGGHSWTPDTCCGEINPCPCPPGVESYSEVTLVYLDCDVVGVITVCDAHEDCADDGVDCNGEEKCCTSYEFEQGNCTAQNLCFSAGNPCAAEGQICVENGANPHSCEDCDPLDDQCEAQDGLFCNGYSYCDESGETPICVTGDAPCEYGGCEEAIDACLPCE